MGDLSGYKGAALRFLEKAGAAVGDVLEVRATWGTVTGTLVPRYLYGDGEHIVIKLKSGYNVGLSLGDLSGVRVVAKGDRPSFSPPQPPKPSKDLPKVLVIGTGGTIASRIDYRTGAVRPAVTSEELHAMVPELSQVARVEPEIMFDILSENITPAHWTRLARRVAKAVDEGADGVVVTHGTDTLGYTAAALSFALAGVPIPVVLVGAQRSPDRPSSDAPLNLIAAVSVAGTASFSGVYVAMHQGESDDKIALHRGTRVRKNHTSRRDAFESVDVPLAAVWGRGGLEHVADGLPPRGREFKPSPRFDGAAALLKFYPSMPGGLVRAAKRAGAKVIVMEGTGLGHVSKEVAKELRLFIRSGGVACMTSQCVRGRLDLSVYDTGRDLTRMGVLPLGDMLAETALVKAMWVLGTGAKGEKARKLMAEDLAGETTTRTFPG
ncbi:MAG: Glu-tRNA(Gln) amidotransferase subunit GatD [Nitrososphaerota archaeon]|jgi:glutamyl-tRNA(Gln) amidotransferase subunit D|nr:Glu-tRNA(Gln) amidotransferase subunit GatD [Nitrososphaerota archaeon]MDG6937986.1 Glu-tRNA(Gln) amidotransferase subunit GatD [Nitrososphaerota archaeon]MDG6962057.1 Glu-tRNA(Gln) amidotransferase subunit GatD [Nitrososphaerota archaeon]MDG6980473.1 Glu-tRNA(Gln) amidotransferase subunit GatD [Nitrososphaerota archaeon]MDG6987181.1 Glu-tRNA(Gln) amidotransferase subunit GatD [Nitrososphaerota archaeon]